MAHPDKLRVPHTLDRTRWRAACRFQMHMRRGGLATIAAAFQPFAT
jgi:hypothetical protein